jgi:Ecdysteroid kinase-like family
MNREDATPVMDVSGVDHEWLRNHLGWPLRGDEAISRCSMSHTDGIMGSVHQVSCAGRSAIFKGTPDGSGRWQDLVIDTGLLTREVQAYRLLAGRGSATPKVSPECYWSALGLDGRGALALEDLGPAASLSRVMASGLDRAQALAAVRSLAIVHSIAATPGPDPLSLPYPWLYSATSEGLITWLRLGLDDLPRIMAECFPAVLREVELRSILEIDVAAVLLRSHVGAHCVSLCHGDAWAGNILFPPLNQPVEPLTAYLIDWQFAMWGNPLSDVALLAWSSLAPASRAGWEDELLSHYHATLTAHGDLKYSLQACRDDYRRAEPFAVLVALASLDAYISGMGPRELSRFALRVRATLRRAAILAALS